MFTKGEFVVGLITILTFSSAVQILITGTLSFKFSHFLGIVHCNLATAAGVLSGLVAVPVLVQLKTSQISPHIDRKYGYTIWYRRLAVGVCGLLHLASIAIVLYSLIEPKNANADFIQIMGKYNQNLSSKSLVDNIQWALQCCGAKSYEDWRQFDLVHGLSNAGTTEYFKHYKNEFSPRNQVPFSCCARNVLGICLHYDLEIFGTSTINTDGCAYNISSAAQLILLVELFIYCVCFGMEVTILMLLHWTGNVEEEFSREFLIQKYLKQARRKPLSNYSNDTPYSTKGDSR